MKDSNVRYRVFVRKSNPFVGTAYSWLDAETMLNNAINMYNTKGGYIEKIERVFELPEPITARKVMVRITRGSDDNETISERYFMDWTAAEAYALTQNDYSSLEISDQYTSVIN